MDARTIVCTVLLVISFLPGCQTDFVLHHPSTGELYRIRCGEALRLPLPTTDNRNAKWSPDGLQIAYHGHDRNGPAIFLTNESGTQLRNLTHRVVASPTPDFVWGPTGEWIYYTAANTTGTLSIYRVNVTSESSVPQALTPLSLNSRHPDISHDGSRMVYASNHPRDLTTYDIYTSRADGMNRSILVETPGVNDHFPSWGPDGRVAFVRGTSVVLRELNGSIVELGSYAGPSAIGLDRLAWSASGRFLAFTGGGGHVYIANTSPPYDNLCLHCPGLNQDWHPRWYDNDSKIAFYRPVGDLPPVGSPEGAFSIRIGSNREILLFDRGANPDPRPVVDSMCFGS